MSLKLNILHLATQNQEDPHFYGRWRELGLVYIGMQDCKQLFNVDVLVVDHRVKVTDNLINTMPQLKYICSANTAHTHIKCDYANRGIKLISLKGETEFLSEIRSVSEFTMQLILNISRPLQQLGHILHGKSLGIVGYGRIGKQVEKLARGFGMDTCWVDKNNRYKNWVELFSTSDYVSIHLSESKSTFKIIGRDLINMMKPSSFFINTARGSIIDEMALAQALNTGRILGAAIDTVEDPLAINETVQNCLLTDHIGGGTIEDRISTDAYIVYKLKNILGPKGQHH